jgi:hypothetical protein
MPEFSSLPADQRAALQLLLTQGQTYSQLADLLRIEPAAVRQRAVSGLTALGPAAGSRLDPEVRGQLADYLLGQQSVSEREATRDRLAGSPAARAWARAVAGELRPIAGEALPEIPEGGLEPEPMPRPTAPSFGAGAHRGDEGERAFEADAPRADRDEDLAPYAHRPDIAPRRSSRLGGALLLGGLGVIIAVAAVLLITSGGDDNKKKSPSTLSTNPSTQTSSTQSNQPVAQINLFSPSGSNKTVGLAQVFKQGNRRAIIAAGQGLTPGIYALWLYNSPSSFKLLGFVPQPVKKDGKFATQGVLPSDASKFAQLIVTRENVTSKTRTTPTRPGTIVLRGALKLG